MKNIFNTLFRRNKINEQQVIGMMYNEQQKANAHVIALARLLFIKPERLVEESKNYKANAEYLLQMIEAEKEQHDTNS